jgi:DNA-binding NtrC family response regulator/Tfp pilus assembly protein PilF
MKPEATQGKAFREAVAHYIASLVDKREFAGAIRCYEEHRSAVDAAGDTWAGQILHQVARAYASLSEYPAALKAARNAQHLLSGGKDNLPLAELFLTLGHILRDMGEVKEARRSFGDAESIFRRYDHPEGQSRALNCLAGLHYRQGRYRQALSVLLEAVNIARHLDDKRRLAYMMGNIGRIYTFIGEFGQAAQHLETNIELSAELGDGVEAARARIALGYTHLQAGDYEAADDNLHQGLDEARRLGLRRDTTICITYIGELEYRSGNLQESIETLTGALRSAIEVAGEESSLAGRVMRHLAEAYRRSGDRRRAGRMAARGLAIMREAGDKVEQAGLIRLQGLLQAAENKTEQARENLQRAIDMHEESGVRFETAESLLAAGQCEAFEQRQRLTYLFRAEDYYARNRLNRGREMVGRALSAIDYRPGQTTTHAEPKPENKAEFITANPDIKRILEQLAAVGKSDLPLLITGETGVGKDHLARYFHSITRPDGPYEAINCASLPESLLESELFGYDKGAFTGADGRKDGRFKAADGGVLLLDEIGDMPLRLQTKLLHVLETRTVTPLGSTRKIALDFKLVAATNQDLETMVEDGRFRRDLYYRLSGMSYEIPPLRERTEDIALLLKHMMCKHGLLTEGESPPVELVRQFLAYDWPGNVRELVNKVQRLEIMRDLAADGDLGELARGLFGGEPPRENLTLFEQVERYERQLLVEALTAAAGNRSEAARMLGIHEATVRTKLKRYNISLEGGMVS